MRTAALAASTVFLAAGLSGPAAAQNNGEALMRSILEGFLGPQVQQQQQQSGPQTAGVRFQVTDLYGDTVCEIVFSGAGTGGAASPAQDCPGALRIVERWDQPGDDLALRDGGNRLMWRGEPTPGQNAWTGGAADSLRVYTIGPSAQQGPNRPTSQQPADGFAATQLYGDWRVTRPGQSFGCRITFIQPDPPGSASDVQTRAGCPGDVFAARMWSYTNRELALTDAFGNRVATLRRDTQDRWTGQSAGADITMTRN